MQLPDNFQPLSLSRDSDWAATPLSAQTFIWEQQRELARLQQDQRSVWANRYRDDEFRLASLQKAHKTVLKDLQKRWDDGCFEGAGYSMWPVVQTVDAENPGDVVSLGRN